MNGFLRQSTASQTRTIGPFIELSDFITPDDTLTIANTDIRLKKNGAADVAKNSGGGTADVNGFYAVTWDATDTDTVGELQFSAFVGDVLLVWGSYTVLEEAIYDALFAASANVFTGAAGSNEVRSIAANGIAQASLQNSTISAAKIGTGALEAAKFAVGAIESAAFAAGAINAAALAADTGLKPIRSNTATAGAATTITLDASASAVDDFYNGALIFLVGGTGIGQARTIIDYVGATKVATVATWATNPASGSVFVILPSAPASVVGTVDANVVTWLGSAPNALTSGRVDVIVGAVTNGVIAAASFASGAFDAVWTVTTRTLSAAGVQAIWDALTSALSTANSIGKLLVDNINATISSRASQTSVDDLPTNAELATALTNLDATVSSRATPAQVNAEVVDALNVDTYGEPTGVPPATASIQRKISQNYMALRNGVVVNANTGNKEFLDDGGSVEWTKAFTDAGGVYTENEGA